MFSKVTTLIVISLGILSASATKNSCASGPLQCCGSVQEPGSCQNCQSPSLPSLAKLVSNATLPLTQELAVVLAGMLPLCSPFYYSCSCVPLVLHCSCAVRRTLPVRSFFSFILLCLLDCANFMPQAVSRATHWHRLHQCHLWYLRSSTYTYFEMREDV